MSWLFALTLLAAQSSPTYQLVNGRWFDGDRFAPRTAFIVEGRLSFREPAPARVDSVVDLAGRYVIPPFAEAHNHNLNNSPEQVAEFTPRYLRAGVFYARMQSNMPLLSGRLRHLLNHPAAVDVAFANAPVTATGGHPVALRQRLLAQGVYPGFTKQTLEGQGYVLVDKREDLERQWPAMMAYRPDFLKIILVHSEEFARRKNDTTFFGNKGLDPALVPGIVALAHAHALPVSAHVQSAGDFRVAVAAGVDQIAHLPGTRGPQILSEADARRAAERGVVVVTTASLALRLRESDPELFRAIQDAQRKNLALLHRAGVTLAIGSDEHDDTSVGEVRYLRELGVFDELALLRMWTTNAARAVFPGRRIGALREGYEASFLVLESDPLENFESVSRIRLRFKDGRPLLLDR